MRRLAALSCLVFLVAGCASQTIINRDFPLPYLSSAGQNEIVFIDLPASCIIEIFTLAGERVKTITVNNGDGQASWDLKNETGEVVESDTYTYVVKSAEGERKGKLAIIK